MVSDGYGGIATEGFYVTINRAPLIASGGFTATVTESGQVTGGSGALLAGDSDPDGYALTITGVHQGFFSAASGSVLDGTYGQLTVNPDGSYSYTAFNTAVIHSAETGAPPVEDFTLSVSDGYGATATAARLRP